MKQISLLLLALALHPFAWGQNEQQKEAEVRAMELVEAQALLQKDIATLQQVWSPGFMVNAPLNAVFTGGQVEMVQAGIIAYTSFTRTVEEVLVLKDVVITMGLETVVPAGADPLAGQTVLRRYTNIWSKEKGRWVLVARHASNICPAATAPRAQARNTTEPARPGLEVTIRRNPSPHAFHLHFGATAHGRLQLSITDSHGRLLEARELPAGTGTLSIGAAYPAGVYFAQVTQGTQRKTVKLVKQ